jgi:hypothetical protein
LHFKSVGHLRAVESFNRKRDLQNFTETSLKSGENFMMLDLEGNIIPSATKEKMMILLEISYIIFCFDEKGELQFLKSHNSLVQPGDKMSDYEESLVKMLNFTMAHRHGLSFKTCENNGVSAKEAWNLFKSDFEAYNVKKILSKGVGMEKMFISGCQFQKNFLSERLASGKLPIIDLHDLFHVKSISDQELVDNPNCGNHLPDVTTKRPLHCSLGEVHVYLRQLHTFLQSCKNISE